MKNQLNKQNKHACMIVPALFFAFAMGAAADTVTPSVFLEFAFSDAGTPATGCQLADPSGAFCIPSSGTATSFLGSPPWTISFPSQGGELTVTDAFLAGDRFQIFDFGTSIGLTSVPFGTADCGDDPVVCLATPGISEGSFLLGGGNHSLTIIPTLSGGGGAAYLRVDPVPEPSLWILTA